MNRKRPTTTELLQRIAVGAHGVVTRRAALAAGVSDREITGRLRSGTLLRVHRGVYRLGHRAPSNEARYLAAVSACGDGAALSGLAAAHLFGLLPGPAPAAEVSCPTERRVRGVITRRIRRRELETTTWRGLPCTTVPGTLVDLAGRLDPEKLARAVHEAAVRYDVGPADLERALARWPSAPGAAKLRRVIHGETRVSLSVLERRFLQLLERERLPLPETNVVADERRVDCRWPALHLTVELDSYRYHGSRHAWELDRRRERDAYRRGDQIRRYTYGDVLERPGPMLAELRAIIPCT